MANQPNPRESRRPSSTTSPSSIFPLPPDVKDQRHKNINDELIAMFKKPADPSASRTSFKGNGTYTHIEKPARQLFPHEKFLAENEIKKYEFLPLGGGKENEAKFRGKHGLRQLDGEIDAAYQALKEAVKTEERAGGEWEKARSQYGTLHIPTMETPRADGDTEMGGMEEKPPSLRISTNATPSMSAPSDVQRPSVAEGGYSAVTSTTTTNATPTGTQYDASRDPRLRRP
ncbi:hypothetical protein EJ04DRAFT_570829 [Polyplosphaeria fusca]|uniref:Uncharacterized protein n=1 Tax=Polyplosphaeria fusca TaxID=682080 RepID=A0A9P4QLI1_9PLEO|nr:hypothetical protein EJ04DRAFT_570829 [Polyplosphaeria fusca]